MKPIGRFPYFCMKFPACVFGLVAQISAIIVQQPSFPYFYSGIPDQVCTAEDVARKPLDLIVYGAHGFMGQHGIAYLMDKHTTLRWGVGGRDYSRIRFDLIDVYGARGEQIPIFEADLHNGSALLNMTQYARVVLSFAGPYEEIGGENLVHAAVVGCTHYVDISTETKWKRHILNMYSTHFQARGLTIVQSAGFEAMASDILAASAVNDFVSAGQPPPTHVLIVWETANGGVGGTKYKADDDAVKFFGLINDPYILAPEVPAPLRVDLTVDGHENTSMGFSRLLQTVVSRYVPAIHDCTVVRRSMHLQFPDSPIAVQEVCTSALINQLFEFRHMYHVPVGGKLKPGEGPPVIVQKRGNFQGKAIALYRNPESNDTFIPFAQVEMYGLGDPYYVGSVKMAVELSMGLASGPARTGYATPSTALKLDVLQQILASVDNGNFIQLKHGQ